MILSHTFKIKKRRTYVKVQPQYYKDDSLVHYFFSALQRAHSTDFYFALISHHILIPNSFIR